MAPEKTQVLSLCEAGAGILDTHVTWEDIEHNMQISLGTKATFGPNKTVKNVGEGNGFLSRMCLIHPDWQNLGAYEKHPGMFIAKLCTCYASLSFSKMCLEQQPENKELFQSFIDKIMIIEKDIRKYHNSECNVYRLLNKYGAAEKMQMPKMYFTQKFTEADPVKGHIIMDYMNNLHPVHSIDNLPVDAIKQVLRSLAVMAGTSLRFAEEERNLFVTEPCKEVFGKWMSDDAKDYYTKPLRAFGEGRLDELTFKIEECVEEIQKLDQYDSIPQKLGIRSVLCHGDVWSTNVLWRKIDNEYKLAAVVDYQTAHFGSPGIDLTRLFITGMSGKDRRENFDSLIETFYGYLLDELNGEEAPFTLEQLKLSYELYFPFAAYLAFPVIGPFIEAAVKNCEDPEEKAKLKELILEKVECLLEDMLFYYEKHQKKSNN